MEHLKDYCLDVCVIDGLQTYIISPAKYDVLIKDNELLNCLKKTDKDIQSVLSCTLSKYMDVQRVQAYNE